MWGPYSCSYVERLIVALLLGLVQGFRVYGLGLGLLELNLPTPYSLTVAIHAAQQLSWCYRPASLPLLQSK